MHYLAIDPGVSHGWAVFSDEGLVACGGGKGQSLREAELAQPWGVGPFTHVVIERPEIYDPRNMKGNPNDIVTLAIQVGRFVERYEAKGAEVHLVLPKTWKGQIPKGAHHARVYGALSAQEQQIVADAGKGLAKKALGDMMDAVALGKYAVKAGLFRA